jgi:hypothetical protein
MRHGLVLRNETHRELLRWQHGPSAFPGPTPHLSLRGTAVCATATCPAGVTATALAPCASLAGS